MKRCTNCKEFRPLSEFCKNKNNKDGYHCQCRICKKVYDMARKEIVTVQNRVYYKNHRKGEVARQRINYLKSKYGITPEDKQGMYREQNSRCAICGKKLTEPGGCCVDHDHITGEVRGLLCITCNTGIGMLHDDPVITQKATEYLKTGGYTIP